MAGRTEGKVMRGPKKKRLPLFWIFYVIFVVGMILFWMRVVKYVNDGLVRYEESQPVNTMERVMEEFRVSGLEQYVNIAGDISRFEKAEDYTEAFQKQLKGKILFYLPAKGYQDPTMPRYELFADGEHIGYCSLKEISSEPFFLHFLSLSEWALDSVELESIVGEKAVEITVPESSQVFLNGLPMDERELTGEATVSQEFTYVQDYVAVPRFVTYRAEGLLKEPMIEVQSGDELTVLSVDGRNDAENPDYDIVVTDGLISVTAKGFQESDMPKELAQMVLENTERYTNFFSVDLPGCRGSVSPIKDMFPADSYYLDLADTYRREDMWMYSSHNAPVFKNETVNHYIRYSNELFSCEVYFDKEMLLHKTGKVKVDTTNFRLYYGLLKGEWKILDMVTLLNEEG